MKNSTTETRVGTIERLIELLETVNPTSVNNDGKPGEFVAELCKEGGRSPPRADYPTRLTMSPEVR
jgi:hypothetical protein